MIFGHLNFWEQEKNAMALALQKGLGFLANTDLKALPLGRHDIDGDTIFALVSEYTTEPKADKRPESHEKYIDIQCVAYGTEWIGFSALAENYAIVEAIPDKDLIFYGEVQNEVDLPLLPGGYAVFFPWDVHRPGVVYNEAATVKKIVVKIAVSLLK